MNQKWNILFKGLAAIGAVIIICISISRLIGIGSETLGDIAREHPQPTTTPETAPQTTSGDTSGTMSGDTSGTMSGDTSGTTPLGNAENPQPSAAPDIYTHTFKESLI